MSRTIDDKVVAMSFESTKFESGVSSTISSLDKLKAALKFPDAGKGLQDIENAANKVTFGGLSGAIDKLKGKFGFGAAAQKDFNEVETASGKVGLSGIGNALEKLKGKFGLVSSGADTAFASVERSSGKVSFSGLSSALENLGGQFSVLSGAAAVALGNIATKAVMAGGAFAKSLSIAPITGGLQEYATNLNSIQTILSNTAASGAGLKDVNAALQELNTYSDKTIYNFSEMARNIGTFTAAGVDLKTSTSAIKGIANVAALSGSNSQQASTAMYQLSQAIAAGRVSLQDWNSVVNAGMGGTVFQRALTETAVRMGKLDEGAVKLTGKMKNVQVNGESFRNSIMAKPGEESWLTSDVLTTALGHFTGDMTDAQLAAEGFNAEQIKAIQTQARLATDAATKVKTLAQVVDVAKETAGSGWAQTWQLVFGDFKEARELFTGMSGAVNGFINANAQARNSVLSDWKALGGRKVLIDGIKDAFHNLGLIIKPIKDAFRDVFPAKTGKDLYNFTVRFHDLMNALKPSKETVENLRRTFRGLFALIDIGKQILGGLFIAVKEVFGEVGHGSGGILELTGNLGDMIAEFNQWLHFSGILKTIFGGLGELLAVPVKLVGKLSEALSNLFSSDKGAGKSDAGSGLSGILEALKPGTDAIDKASQAWQNFIDILEHVGDVFQPVVDAIRDAFSNISDAVAKAIESNNWDSVFKVIQTGLIAGIFVTLKRALGGGVSVELGTGGVLAGITKSLDTLRGSLSAIQNNIKADTMVKIATAVALLAAATTALSLINPQKLASAMSALTVSMGELMASLFIMDKVGGKTGFLKAPVIAASLIAMAAAIDVLVIAIAALSLLSWEQLAKGLAGVAGSMVVLAVGAQMLSKVAPQMAIASVGLIPMAVALTILAGAVKIFSTMKWEEMGRGMVGLVLALDAIALASRGISPTILLVGPGVIALAIGLNILAGAMKIMGSMDMATIGKGILAIAGALVAIGLAMQLMPPTMIITAAGLVVVGIALAAIAGTIAILGNMDVSTLAKGIGAIGASLLVLAIGLNAMMASLPGAAALLVAATALTIFVPVLALMASMSWGKIAKGLGAIVLSLVTLAAVGMIAAPGIIALAAALTLLGVGIVLVGAGLYLMTSALVKLAGEGAKGIGITLAAFTAFILALPKVIINFVKGLVEILAAIAEVAPKIVASLVKILESLLQVIIKSSPKFAVAAIALITAVLKVLNAKAPDIIEAGWKLLLALLTGIDNHISEVTKKMIDIVLKFLAALTGRLPEITAAGARALAALLKGIADNLGKVVTAAGDIVVKFVGALANNYGKIIAAGVQALAKFLGAIADGATKIIAAGARVVTHLITGLGNMAKEMIKAGAQQGANIIGGVVGAILGLMDYTATQVIRFINGMAEIVRKRDQEFGKALGNLASAIIQGLVAGIKAGGTEIAKAMLGLIPKKLRGAVSKVLGFSDALRHAVGASIGGGFTDGLDEVDSAVTNTLSRVLASVPDSLDINPVITPVLDLTNIQNGSKLIDAMLSTSKLASTSTIQAALISSGGISETTDEELATLIDKSLTFNQNNYSPEALSAIEIYRLTKNQLAQAASA